MDPVEVLITDGHTRAALAVARALDRRGVSILVLCEHPHSLARYSRRVKHAVPSPSPSAAPQVFVERILELVRLHGIRLVIPITDHSLLALDRHRGAVEAEVKLAMASADALRQVLDKRLNLALARRLGVPCPRQFELRSPDQVPEMIEILGLPIVLKRPGDPSDPNVPAFEFRVLYASTREELEGHIARHCRGGMYPLFQERATGVVHNLCCFAVAGDLVAAHEYHSIRRFAGTGVLRRIVEPEPDLLAYARDLLRALAWDGVAHLGFFLDRDRNKRWYMETNGRVWASVEGSVHAGWDFPYWLYRYFLHGERPDPGPLRIGSLTCWHHGDLLALLNYIRGGESPTTGTLPSKWRAVLQYLGDQRPSLHSDVFRWSDPLPAAVEYGQFLETVRRRVRGKRGVGDGGEVLLPARRRSP